ncbi:MAG: hypothetical protein BZ135_05305 [Methanosphaera sp. rholeuAM6]|nr:MAG: hypothetical protein BZ135_05305 [Methanosphaera sp. rholeuAM6]
MERIVYADYLRVIGILGVMGVHLCGNYLSKTPLFSGIWYQGALFYSITRSGVLLFVLVSGLLLLDRPQSIDRLPHRIERVMVPFVFWLFVFYLKMIFIDHSIVAASAYDFVGGFVNCILNPNIISIEFWYIYMIIGFYLMLPIIRKWISNTDEREIKYFLVVWFAVLVLNYFNTRIMILEYVNLFTGYLGFFVLGYYLNTTDSKYANSFTLGLALFIAGTLMMLLSILIPTWMSGQLNMDYVGYLNLAPSSVFKAMGMFLMLKNVDFKTVFKTRSDSVNEFMRKFAEITFGLYLIHLLIPLNGIWSIELSPFINIPVCLAVIIVVTYVVLNVMNRIPILQRFTGMKY